MKKLTLSIGIPAHNAELNIARLLKKLIKQRCKTVEIKNIIVLSDASSDKTIQLAQQVVDPRIKIISNKTRHGFAYGIKKIISLEDTDIVVLLNDDIIIKNTKLIENLCSSLIKDNHIGLVGGNIQPLPSNNFIQRTSEIGFILLRRTSNDMKTINNNLTCDGKILALSKKFYKRIIFPTNLGDMGNVDSYLYFSCLEKGFLYRFAKNAVVYFKFMDTIDEFIKFSIRNRHSSRIIYKKFKKILKNEPKPKKRFFQYLKLNEIFIFSPYLIMFFILHYWILLKEKNQTSSFSHIWSVVESTKKLNRI